MSSRASTGAVPAPYERQLPSIAQLRSFVCIAASGSLGRAADTLQTSQSTLSYQIDQLEEQLGVLLLNRTRRGVTLTEAGHAILRQAQSVLLGLGEMTSEAQSYAKGVAGHVALGVQAYIQVLGPRVALRFRELHPEVRLSLREANAQVVRQWLLDERVDIGVLWDVVDDDRMTSAPLGAVEICLVGSASARKPPPRELEIEDLHEIELVMPTPANNGRQRMDRNFADRGVAPVVAFNSDSLYTTKELVRRGAACALLPRFVVKAELAAGDFWAVRVNRLCADETVRLIKLKNRSLSPAGLELQKIVLEQFAKLDNGEVAAAG